LKILIETLQNDPEGSVRRRAALALGRLADEEAKEALYQAMIQDKDIDTQRNAAIALAKFGDERAILPLFQFYSAPKSNNFFENIDRARVNLALTELAEMKEKKTIEELVEWFKSEVK
jgi:HEAT repeat protein